MIAVCNTSPLTNLAAIGQFGLLRYVFGQLRIPEGVWAELNAYGTPWPGATEVAAADWVSTHKVSDHRFVTDLRADLGLGEAEAIALALEQSAEVVLLDEKEARHRAQRLGLKTMGVCGVLLAAKAKGHIQLVRPHLDALHQRAGFRLSAAVRREVLELAGEGVVGP